MTDTTDTTGPDATEMEAESREFAFDADRLPRLDEEIARLNKIAAKLGAAPLSYTEVSRGTRKETVGSGWGAVVVSDFEIETVTILIHGTSPRLAGGWKFLGSVEFLPDGPDGEKLTLVHGDDERLVAYRAAGPDCDHCGHKRNRRKVVVLENDETTTTVVGSTCLKDFLGYHGDPEKVLRFAEDLTDTLNELDDEGGRFGRPDTFVPAAIFLATAAATVRVFGWTPKSSYAGIPTATRVADILFPPRRTVHNADYLDELAKVKGETEDAERAALIKVWAGEAAAESPGNTYLGNLAVILAGSYVDLKHFGLGASAVGAYDKAMGKAIERKTRAEIAANSEWVGTIGKREVFSGTVTAVIPYDTQFGSGRVVKILDAAGNVLKSLTSGAWACGLNVGDEVTVKATVKSHDTWNGAKETNLTRATMV